MSKEINHVVLKVYTTPAQHIKVRTDAGETHIKVSHGSTNLPVYTGDYVVIPRKTQDILLDTKNKAMLDNVTVEKIHYTETSNESGGMTAIIGFD